VNLFKHYRILPLTALLGSGFVASLDNDGALAQEAGKAREAGKAEPSGKTVAKLALPATDDGLPGAGPIRRYEWFEKLWLQRRTEWQAEKATHQGAVVFFGDSITQGWGKGFQGKFGDALLANRGISGDTTRGMLIRLEEDVLTLKPKGIVLLMGTNDLEEKAEPKTIADNLVLILNKIREYDATIPIVLCNIFPASASKARPADKIKEINNRYQSAVKGNTQVTVIDTWTLFADEKGDAKPVEFPDLLHPNAIGYDKWAKAIRPVLEWKHLIKPADEQSGAPEAGFRSLFNGKDLSGWCFRPTTDEDKKSREKWLARDPNAVVWPVIESLIEFKNKEATTDGRYVASNSRLLVTSPAEGRRIQQLWTVEEFGDDFQLRLEFRATPNADSGVFLRGKQLQCRDYSLAGPYKTLQNYKPQEWNQLDITVKGTTARCLCNGEVLEEAFVIPKSGPIGLEGDRGHMEYRNIWIKIEK
jgi:lysophospholipase L1-like esterase